MKRVSLATFMLLAGLGLGAYFVGTHSHGQQKGQAALAIPKELTSYRDIVKQVLPGVVSIEVKHKAVAAVGGPNGAPGAAPKNLPFDEKMVPPEFRKFLEQMPRGGGDGAPIPRGGFGSGFFIDPAGVILTNNHVIEGAEQVTVHLQDGRKFTSRNIKGDRRTDLAVVVLDAKGPFPTLEMGDSDLMDIGDRVLAVGAPFGLTGTVTQGIVSAKGRTGMHMNMYEDFIQTDAAINPGNSGGPLVNLEGKVIGINSAIKSRSGGSQGIGLAISSNMAAKIANSLRTEGVVRRGFLGVQVRELDPEVAARLNLPKDSGVVIGEVYENSPAAKAGLKAGDILTAIAGKSVKDAKSVQTIVAESPLGKALAFTLRRNSQNLTLNVTIVEQPADFGTAQAPVPSNTRPNAGIAVDKVGVELADLNDEMADMGHRKGTPGVVITRVNPGSVAADAGLRRGMLVNQVDGQRVTSASAARQALESADLAKGILLQVHSAQGGTNFVILKANA